MTLGAAILTGSAAAACTVGTPVVDAASAYVYQADTVQSVTVPFSCAVTDSPVLTFSSAGGSFSPVSRRFDGFLNATNGDRLQFYVPDVYGSSPNPAASSFVFQVIVPLNQWGASTGTYSGTLNVVLTF